MAADTTVEKPAEKPVEKKELRTTAVIKISGNDVVVHKLKAGKFYELQKIFSEIITAVSENRSDVDKNADKPINLASIFVTYPDKVADFVSRCIEWDKKKLLDEAYPEEINQAYVVCLELNNVAENIKNFVAPMEIVGAVL